MTNKSTIEYVQHIELHAARWMTQHGTTCMRFSIGIIFLWFGALKLFPGHSPAEALAGQTIQALTLGIIPAEISVPLLGVFESLLGICLLTRRALRLCIYVLFAHMLGTALPFIVLPRAVFGNQFLSLTLEGQFIFKNLVIVSGAMLIAANPAAHPEPNTIRQGRSARSAASLV